MRRSGKLLLVAGVASFVLAGAASAQQVVLHLKSGDRLAGKIVTEVTNRVIIATEWINELPVPVSAITNREDRGPRAPSPSHIVAAGK